MVTTLQGVDLSMDCMMRVFANLGFGGELRFRSAFGYGRFLNNDFGVEVKANIGLLQEFETIYDEYCVHRLWSTGYRALKNVAETGIVYEDVLDFYERHRDKNFVLKHFQHKPPKKLEVLTTFYQFNLMNVVKDFHALTHVTITTCLLKDDDIKPLPLLHNLKFLNLSENSGLSGKYISECRKVVALYLRLCRRIDSFHMSEIAEALRLERLNIMDCTLLTNQRNSHIMNEIFPNLDCLYQLFVDASIDKCIFPFIGGLMPKLKILNINADQINLNELLSALANNRNIEAVYIRDDDYDDDDLDEDLDLSSSRSSMDWSLISKIPRLKKLYIVSGYLEPFQNEVLNPMPHLEEIYLESCDNISHTSLVTLYNACPNLNTCLVTLYNACPNLNTWCVTDFRHVNTIFHIIKTRRQETRDRDIPLTFVIDNEIDFEAIINDKRYKSAAAAGLVDVRLAMDFPRPDWITISPNVIE